jgi:hypothetical protein
MPVSLPASTRLRVLAATVVAAAVVIAVAARAAGAPASGGDPASPESHREPAPAPTDYWTKERMENAEPAPMPITDE